MNPDEPKRPEPSPEEIATIIDWIDGNLAPEHADAFELRLGHDRELARQVEEMSNLDAFLRRDARARALAGRAAPRRGWWVAAAAAALLVVAIAPALLQDRPPGIAASRGGNPRLLGAEEFLRASEAAEDATASQALATRQREIEAGWFVVPIELRESAAVIVLGFPQQSPGLRLLPESSIGLTAAGRHILPAPRAVRGRAPDTVEYSPGFLVPIGAKEVTVLVAVSARVEGPLIEDIDAWLAGGESADQVAARLGERGFRVERLLVRE